MSDTIEKLCAALVAESGDNWTTITVFINCQGVTVTHTERSAESLKKDGISMRNVRGEFITN